MRDLSKYLMFLLLVAPAIQLSALRHVHIACNAPIPILIDND